MFFGTNSPADFENFGIIVEFRADAFQFRSGFSQVTQFKPAKCGGSVMHLWRLELVHSMGKIREDHGKLKWKRPNEANVDFTNERCRAPKGAVAFSAAAFRALWRGSGTRREHD